MRYKDSDFHLLHFATVDPKAERKVRRANVIVISFLAFFVLGLFLATMLPSGQGVSRAVKTFISTLQSAVS